MSPLPARPLGFVGMPLPHRFWSKVDIMVDGCWTWTGATNRGGYPVYRLHDGTCLAHRAAYESLIGAVPDGLYLDHLCRVHPCVRPDHLEPVTNRENVLRGDGFIARQVAKALRSLPEPEPAAS